MFIPRFNSRPVVNKNRPVRQGFTPGQDFVLDDGFDDLGMGAPDVRVAPGIMAHFSRLPNGALHGSRYHAMRPLERIDSGR